MISEVFFADRPRPELRDRLGVFQPLIGSWSLIVDDFEADGTVGRREGEWHFGWALDGRALVDVWICPSRAAIAAGAPDGEWGTSIRFWDERIDAFRSTWHGPQRGWVIPFQATTEDGGIVLRGRRDGGVDLAWIFSDVTEKSFSWRAEEREPGATWRIRQRFAATRTSFDKLA
jgi:hypothetical protein